MQTKTTTHEDYLTGLRTMVVDRAVANGSITNDEATTLRRTRLMYGVGNAAVRGTCYYEAWDAGVGKIDVVEIGAAAQENWVQLTGTTVHELAHVLAGHAAGHGPDWKRACVRLGFRVEPAAAGQKYHLSLFVPAIRHGAFDLAARIADGSPAFTAGWLALGGLPITIRPCSAGIGTRGGKSRGVGSGSRLRLWECGCAKPVKVRVASDAFAAHCDVCNEPFTRKAA